jgi:hypothetical protein
MRAESNNELRDVSLAIMITHEFQSSDAASRISRVGAASGLYLGGFHFSGQLTDATGLLQFWLPL